LEKDLQRLKRLEREKIEKGTEIIKELYNIANYAEKYHFIIYFKLFWYHFTVSIIIIYQFLPISLPISKNLVSKFF